jgi:hypothetical protein
MSMESNHACGGARLKVLLTMSARTAGSNRGNDAVLRCNNAVLRANDSVLHGNCYSGVPMLQCTL